MARPRKGSVGRPPVPCFTRARKISHKVFAAHAASDEQCDAVHALARRRKISLSELIRSALDRELREDAEANAEANAEGAK